MKVHRSKWNLSEAWQGLRLVYSYAASTHVRARLIPQIKNWLEDL